jgi:hypothetical protein
MERFTLQFCNSKIYTASFGDCILLLISQLNVALLHLPLATAFRLIDRCNPLAVPLF